MATNKELMEKVRMLELAEEGAKEAFGVVVEKNHALEKEVKRLQGLLNAAYEIIRRKYHD